MPARKSGIVWVIVSALIFCLLGTLLYIGHPSLLTGRYYQITITAVEFDRDGYASITYDDVLTYKTKFMMDYVTEDNREAAAGSAWSMESGGFLWRPRTHHRRTVKVSLATAEERRKGIDPMTVHERLLVTKGIYRIWSGQRLEWYRRTKPDGTVTTWMIQAYPDYGETLP